MIELSLEGSAPFTASCTLTDADGAAHELAFDAVPPLTRSFHGRHLRCAIALTDAGELTVTMTAAGNRARTRTSGAGSRVILAQGG